MIRILIIIVTLFIISCRSETTDKSQAQPDTVSREAQQESESAREDEEYFDVQNFDLLVQKYEDPDRGRWQNPDYVIAKLGDLQGKVVADIGVGSGYFTFRIAKQADKVIAVDIDQRFLDYIEERKLEISQEVADKIISRLALKDDPLLANEEVDIVLMVNTYHYLSNRAAYLRRVSQGMQRGGIIVIVDFKEGEMPVGPPEDLKVPSGAIISEMEVAGFEKIELDESSLQYQYIVKAYN